MTSTGARRGKRVCSRGGEPRHEGNSLKTAGTGAASEGTYILFRGIQRLYPRERRFGSKGLEVHLRIFPRFLLRERPPELLGRLRYQPGAHALAPRQGRIADGEVHDPAKTGARAAIVARGAAGARRAAARAPCFPPRDVGNALGVRRRATGRVYILASTPMLPGNSSGMDGYPTRFGHVGE